MNPDGSCEGRFGESGPPLWNPLWRPGSQPGLGPIRCVDLRLTLKPTTHPAALGEAVPISFLLDNDGSEPATAVHVELKAAEPIRLAGGAGCSGPPLDVVCTIDLLAPRTTQLVTFTASSTTAGNYPLTVSAGAIEPDSDPSTNTMQTGVQVLPCTEVGTFGDDFLYGSPGPDRICGLTGADHISGGAGNDYLNGDGGADIIGGGPGHDTILGKGGNDTIYARDGERDWIDCGTERDVAVVDRFDRTFHCETVVRPKKR
jgi:Ca2+-binding RTX toxin-like protein